MKKIYLIGVDGGTESLRAGVFDHAGVPLAYAATTYATEFPAPGWAEQNPQDWWSALGQSVREAVKKAGIRPDQVTAMTVDTTCCSVVALDSAGNAVRPALIWMDVRSAKQAEQLVATGDAALCINSNGNGPVSAEWMIPKALWIQQNEPELFDRAFTVCEYQDYLNLHLTGHAIGKPTALWVSQEGQVEFYDLSVDPGCMNDLVEERHEEAARYRRMLVDWLLATEDRGWSGDQELSEEVLSQLADLGYTGPSDPGSEGWWNPDTGSEWYRRFEER